MLGVLLAIQVFNTADRLAIGIALQNIKEELHLSDVQLGFLTGLAFTAFFATIGVPIARWADRGNRVRIISITAAVWGVMVAMTGRVSNFVQILLVRVGVGVGDAGTYPIANSLIPEYFSRAERPRAAAVYMMSWPATVVLGYFVAGYVNERYGWRPMFVLMGLPGIGLAILAGVTLREPRLSARRVSADPRSGEVLSTHPTIKAVLLSLRSIATFKHLLISYAVIGFYTAGTQQWLPAFFVRTFGLRTAALGAWLALTVGSGSLLGLYAGGAVASRYAAGNERLQFKLVALICVCIGANQALVYLSPYLYGAFAFVVLGSMMGSMVLPALMAAFQTLTPKRMRATTMAIVMLITQLIGAGLGPMAAGALSESLRPEFGAQSLRIGLAALSPLCLWGAFHMWAASRTVIADLRVEHGAGSKLEQGE